MTATVVNSAGRLDRRFQSAAFHWRLFALIGTGMFFDGLDSYTAGGVLGALTKSRWSDLVHNAHIASSTFISMTIGAVLADIMGDHLGRCMAYQINLLIFGPTFAKAA